MKTLPNLKATGIWVLAAPFDKSLTANVVYTCEAVNSAAAIVADGGDPFLDYYASPFDIPQSKYEDDLKAGVFIVKLQSTSGMIVNVPVSYIVNYPGGGGIPYRNMMVGVDLGVIPKSLELAYLLQKFKEITTDVVGVEPKILLSANSEDILIDQVTAKALESARQAKITDRTTDRAKLIAANALILSLQQHTAELEKYIQENP